MSYKRWRPNDCDSRWATAACHRKHTRTHAHTSRHHFGSYCCWRRRRGVEHRVHFGDFIDCNQSCSGIMRRTRIIRCVRVCVCVCLPPIRIAPVIWAQIMMRCRNPMKHNRTACAPLVRSKSIWGSRMRALMPEIISCTHARARESVEMCLHPLPPSPKFYAHNIA